MESNGRVTYKVISWQAVLMIFQAKRVCAHQLQNEHHNFQYYDLNHWCFSYISAEWGEAGMDENDLHLYFNYDSVEWWRKSHCSSCRVGVVGFVELLQTMLTVALPAYKTF